MITIVGYRPLAIDYEVNAPFVNTKSLQFDGLTASVNLGTPTETAFDRLDPFSISAWIKLDSVKNHTVISNQLNGSPYRGINFIVNTSNKVVVFLANSSSSRFTWTSTIALTNAVWYNITFTYDGSSHIDGGNIYINGALDANPLDSGVVSLTTVSGIPYYLGARQGAANFFDGFIDEVSIYNTELTPTVIANDIYNLGTPKDLSALNPLVWYRNGDGDTYPTIIDNGSVGSDGTMTNMIAGDIVPDVPPTIVNSYLVDNYSPYIAYDLRKISSTATNSIRVRRLSDNVEQDIGFNGDALDESALTTFCSGTDGFVTTFYDQSGNSLNAVMATASSQPRICLNGVIDLVNGKPAILSDGVNDSLRAASLVGSLPNTQFALYDKVGTSGYFGAFATTSITGFGPGATGSRIYQNGAAFGPYSTLNTQALLMFKSTELTASDWKFYENGSEITNSGQAIGTSIYNNVSLFDRPNNTSRCNMYMQTYLMFNSDESITNRVAIQDNINTYYTIY